MVWQLKDLLELLFGTKTSCVSGDWNLEYLPKHFVGGANNNKDKCLKATLGMWPVKEKRYFSRNTFFKENQITIDKNLQEAPSSSLSQQEWQLKNINKIINHLQFLVV